MPTSDARKRAVSKYDANNTISFAIKLNKHTDCDIIEKLNSLDNRQGYIKALIRKDINPDHLIIDGQSTIEKNDKEEWYKKYSEKMMSRFAFLSRRLLAINEVTTIMMNPDDSDYSAMRRYIQKKHECFSNLVATNL